MIDYFALALAHALLVIALLRILARGELDREETLGDVNDEPQAQSKQKRPGGTRHRKKPGDA
ncbi:MAG: hypothetical protein MK104_08755 [Erythrobacter sp.]|uniref:hypothetical protein n=1 Tax=Qipengyuania pacifica TaxID=2860199 RepID=UPI0035C847F0|nr:hypothetical protein [Erythrobacter sp.]